MTTGTQAAPTRQRTRQMSGAVLAAPRTIELVRAPVPEPGAGEVLIRLEGCGVCASNLAPWEGRPWFQYPFKPGEMGHEGWGIIESVGEGVQEFQPGQRVATLANGAYAEYMVAPGDSVLALPDSLQAGPFPGEPLGCAFNVFKRSEIRPTDTVAIVGVGFLGAILTRLAASCGARVIAISRRQFSLDVATQLGAGETIPLHSHDEIIERVRRLTDGRMCDRVIEAVGKQWPLDLAGELARERGRLIIAGYHQDGPRQVNMQQWNWRGLDVINAHERDPAVYIDGMRRAARAVASGQLDPSMLYTHRFPLDRLGEALRMTAERPEGFLKALIVM